MIRRRLVAVGVAALSAAALLLETAPTAAGGQATLLDFTTPGCGPCRMMRPVVAELARAGYAVREVDASREPQLVSQYRVDAFPTFIVVVDGREYARLVGATTGQQLAEMIAKSQQLAARQPLQAVRGQSPDGSATDAFQAEPANFVTGVEDSSLQTPQAGRVVELGPPSQSRWDQPTGTARPNPAPQAVGKLTASTVKLSVEDPRGTSSGTGTIIDARSGEALILTCGHIFRESQGRGTIEVTLYDAGPQGPVKREVLAGRMIDYDLERDLGLVSIWINAPVQVAPVAPATAKPQTGDAVTSMGCNGGADPTPIVSRVNSVDRYNGFPNLQAAGAPVEGRSGGGLYNAAGQVVGVCFASDPQADEGLYAGLPSIHAKLDALGLSTVYQQPAGAALAGHGGSQPPQIRGQDPAPPSSASPPTPTSPANAIAAESTAAPANPFGPAAVATNGNNSWPPASASPAADGMTAGEQATLEELSRRAGGSEVICIIRPQQPGAKSEVITVHGATPAFVEALARSAAAARDAGTMTR